MLKNLKKKVRKLYSELYIYSKMSVLNISRPPADCHFIRFLFISLFFLKIFSSYGMLLKCWYIFVLFKCSPKFEYLIHRCLWEMPFCVKRSREQSWRYDPSFWTKNWNIHFYTKCKLIRFWTYFLDWLIWYMSIRFSIMFIEVAFPIWHKCYITKFQDSCSREWRKIMKIESYLTNSVVLCTSDATK